MDTVTILRELWHRRRYVAAVCAVALLAGMIVKFKVPSSESRRYGVGIATAHILVDTPSSQVVNVAPKGSDTTGTRADLLASLMTDGVVESTIAQRAGLQPNQLIASTQAATDPTTGAGTSNSSASPGRNSYMLSTQVLTDSAGDELPIIEVDTQAPTSAGAAHLAVAAVSGLTAYLDSKAALERVPDADRLQVVGLGAPQASTASRGPSDLIAILIMISVFVLGCACILGVVALVRGWRAASAFEQMTDRDPQFVEAPRQPLRDGQPFDGGQIDDAWLAADQPKQFDDDTMLERGRAAPAHDAVFVGNHADFESDAPESTPAAPFVGQVGGGFGSMLSSAREWHRGDADVMASGG